MKEIQHITIQIADSKPIGLDIKRDKEELARKAEKSINKVWAAWCEDERYRDVDVLAMVTFRFAELYYTLLDRMNKSERAITEFEDALDKILLDVK